MKITNIISYVFLLLSGIAFHLWIVHILTRSRWQWTISSSFFFFFRHEKNNDCKETNKPMKFSTDFALVNKEMNCKKNFFFSFVWWTTLNDKNKSNLFVLKLNEFHLFLSFLNWRIPKLNLFWEQNKWEDSFLIRCLTLTTIAVSQIFSSWKLTSTIRFDTIQLDWKIERDEGIPVRTRDERSTIIRKSWFNSFSWTCSRSIFIEVASTDDSNDCYYQYFIPSLLNWKERQWSKIDDCSSLVVR